jgi:hypothetical protein
MRSENVGTLTKLDDGIGVVTRLEGGREPSDEFHVVLSLVLFSLIVFHVVVFPAFAFQFGVFPVFAFQFGVFPVFAFQFGVFHAAHAVCVNVVQSRIPTNRDTILIPLFSLIFSTPV